MFLFLYEFLIILIKLGFLKKIYIYLKPNLKKLLKILNENLGLYLLVNLFVYINTHIYINLNNISVQMDNISL